LFVRQPAIAIDERDLVAASLVDVAVEKVGDGIVGLAAHDLLPPLQPTDDRRGFLNYTAY
jgi:hypothetical protein